MKITLNNIELALMQHQVEALVVRIFLFSFLTYLSILSFLSLIHCYALIYLRNSGGSGVDLYSVLILFPFCLI